MEIFANIETQARDKWEIDPHEKAIFFTLPDGTGLMVSHWQGQFAYVHEDNDDDVISEFSDKNIDKVLSEMKYKTGKEIPSDILNQYLKLI